MASDHTPPAKPWWLEPRTGWPKLPEHHHRSTFRQSLVSCLVELMNIKTGGLTNADILAIIVLLQAVQCHTYRPTEDALTGLVALFGFIWVKICLRVNMMIRLERMSWQRTLSWLGGPRSFVSLKIQLMLNRTVCKFKIDLPASCFPGMMQGTSYNKRRNQTRR